MTIDSFNKISFPEKKKKGRKFIFSTFFNLLARAN